MKKLKTAAYISSVISDISAIVFRVIILMIIFMSYDDIYTYFEYLI